eukprot:scaffold421308_cov64-Attheya_sp.AAC.5
MAIRFGPLLTKLGEDVPLIGFMVMLQFNPSGNRVVVEREIMRNRWKGKVWLSERLMKKTFFSSHCSSSRYSTPLNREAKPR